VSGEVYYDYASYKEKQLMALECLYSALWMAAFIIQSFVVEGDSHMEGD